MSYTDAFEKVSNFYTDKRKFGAASEFFKNGKPLRVLLFFCHHQVIFIFRPDHGLHSRLSKPSRHRSRPRDRLPLRLWNCRRLPRNQVFLQVRHEGAHASGRQHAFEFGGLPERDGLHRSRVVDVGSG